MSRGRAPELTLRALVVGVAVGAVLAAANLYMGLKTGWSDSGNLTAAIVGFSLLGLWSRVSAGAAPSPLETNFVQVTASAAGAMSFALGFGAPIPALTLLGRPPPLLPLFGWGIGVALVGLCITERLRRQLFEHDGLPFPTGIATAAVIETMHRARSATAAGARWLFAGGAAAAAVTWLREGRPRWLPQALFPVASVRGLSASALSLGLSVSPMMLGAGLLVGPQLGASVLVGAIVGWLGVAPALVRRGLVAADYTSAVGWLLWPAVALMLASAVVGLALDLRLWRRVRRSRGTVAAVTADELPPRQRALVAAVALALVFGCGTVGLHLGIVTVVLALALSVLVAIAGVRAAGETDVNPVGTLAQLVQTVLGVTVTGPSANLLGGSLAYGSSTLAGTSAWALRSGAALDASPRRQLYGQLVGVVCGALVVAPAYALLVRAAPIGTTLLPVPAALPWKALADAFEHGAAAIPPGGPTAMAAGAVAGVILTLASRTRLRPLLPAPTAMAVGMLMPAVYSSTIFIGATAAGLVRWRHRAWADRQLGPLAAGVIAGESLIGVVAAALAALGLVR